jgi:hypothetical protein
MRRIALFGALATVALGLSASPAAAEDQRCVGFLSGGPYDNVVVPRNADCNLVAATVRGNVTVLRGAALFSQGNRIGGNLEGNRPRFVGSLGDTIGGNVDITGATGSPGFPFDSLSINVFVCGAQVTNGNIHVEKSRNGTVVVGTLLEVCQGNSVTNGNITVEHNFIPPADVLAVARNTVGGNVQVFRNTGPGGKNVAGNVVTQILQCKGNDQPFNGGPNTARQAEGQCFATPPGAPATLTGETLRQNTAFDGTTTGNCSTNEAGQTSYSLDFSGIATGPYPGTFTEHVDVTIGPPGAPLPIQPFPGGFDPGPVGPSGFLGAGQLLSLVATFAIESPNGDVSGSKTLSGVVPADPTHAGVCAELDNDPGPFGPVSGVYEDFRAFDLVYEATITRTEGSFTDEGTSQAQGRKGRIVGSQGGLVSDVNDFGETFQSTLGEPSPAGG